MSRANFAHPNRLRFCIGAIATAASFFTLFAAYAQNGLGQRQPTSGRRASAGHVSLSLPSMQLDVMDAIVRLDADQKTRIAYIQSIFKVDIAPLAANGDRSSRAEIIQKAVTGIRAVFDTEQSARFDERLPAVVLLNRSGATCMSALIAGILTDDQWATIIAAANNTNYKIRAVDSANRIAQIPALDADFRTAVDALLTDDQIIAVGGVPRVPKQPSNAPDDSTAQQPAKFENGDSLDASASDGDTAGYAVGESDVPDQAIVALNASAGPVRMARFSLVEGDVTWRADDSLDWSAASINLPLRTGAQIWVAAGGHAEVQFDDGSYLRLGRGAVATLQKLYSDSTGEFTQLSLSGGVAMLQIKHDGSIYQVDAPLVSTRADGPARLRFGVGSRVEVGVPEGSATIEGAQGTTTLQEGQFVTVADGAARFAVQSLPGADTWEQWNRDRGVTLTDASQALAQHNLAPNIALVCGDLDKYGTWHTDAKYGEVWCPNVADDKWRPYSVGHWVWVNPFGWTWCSDEPWGWAPYHYGTWFVSDYGWAWRPGPANQYWSPAVVHFTEYEGNVAWCALAPIEVHYPPASVFAIGLRSVRWSEYYSIGQAGCYYPSGDVYCVGRAFRSASTNASRYSYSLRDPNTGSVTRRFLFAPTNNTHRDGHPFIPNNTVGVAGATSCKASAFGERGPLTGVDRDSNEMFSEGRSVGPPALGREPIAGPTVARPTPSAFSSGAASVHRALESPTYTRRPVHSGPVTNAGELMSNYWRVHPRDYSAETRTKRPSDIGGGRNTGIGGSGGRGSGGTGTGIGGSGGHGTGGPGTGSGGTGSRSNGSAGGAAGAGSTRGGRGPGGTGGRGAGTGGSGSSSRISPHTGGGASSGSPSGSSGKSGSKDSGTKDKGGKN